MAKILFGALRCGLWGLLLGPLAAIALVFAAMIFDPKCGAGDSGGCAMGLVTVPLVVALPSFGLFFAYGLLRGVWRWAVDRLVAVRQLLKVGRGD
jgi:hypothetical protein